MTSTKLVLFDIDGTILLTAGAGRRAIVAAISEEVGPSTALQQVRFDGKTDPQIVIELLEAAGHPGPHHRSRVETLCSRYVSLLRHELEQPTSRTASRNDSRLRIDSLLSRPRFTVVPNKLP